MHQHCTVQLHATSLLHHVYPQHACLSAGWPLCYHFIRTHMDQTREAAQQADTQLWRGIHAELWLEDAAHSP